jgi:crossover junction endodeoxyribonuclease RuvC
LTQVSHIDRIRCNSPVTASSTGGRPSGARGRRASSGSSETPIADRLVELEQELDDLFAEHKPDACAVEQLYSNYEHPRTAILMGHARGVILLVARRRAFASRNSLPIGSSIADRSRPREQVANAARDPGAWNLAEPPEPPDVADALAVACAAAGDRSRQAR